MLAQQKGFILITVLAYLMMMTLLTISGWQQGRYAMKLSHGFALWMEKRVVLACTHNYK